MTDLENYGDMTEQTEADSELELRPFTTIVRVLQPLPREARQRVLEAVLTLLGIDLSNRGRSSGTYASTLKAGPAETPRLNDFSEDRSPSPKDFVFDKKPQTDIERIACLAYYLTHYRNSPHFKTLDLSKLNMEAAQLKFSNAANAVDNATKGGLLVPASQGAKQLSAVGELYVQALPDRAAARDVLASLRPRKKGRRVGRSLMPKQNDAAPNN